MDILGPKGLGFLLYGGRAERDLKGHLPVRRVVLVGRLVGPLLFNLGLKGGLEFAHLFSRHFAFDGRRRDDDAVTEPRGLKGGLELARLSSRPVDRDGLEVKQLFDGTGCSLVGPLLRNGIRERTILWYGQKG